MSEEINNSHHYSLLGESQLLPTCIGASATNITHRAAWHPGFVVTSNSSGGVEGVWHTTSQHPKEQHHPSNKLKNTDIRINEQSFFVPPIDNISVSIFIDPYETHVVNQEVSVSLFKDGICTHELNKSLENTNHLVLPSKLFHDNDNGTICVVKHKEDKTIFSYIHISFNINGIPGDVSHAHIHLPKTAGNNAALKFMHFPCAMDNSLHSWILIHNVEDRDANKNEFNLRIFNQVGKESIFYFNFSKQEFIKAINLNELVGNGDDHYIVQLQSYCDNYDSSVFTYNNKTHQTAQDHTTGG